ncbi:MAG: hypothetical protein ABWZ52_01635 [Acidimicrobiales bacterium]
MSLTDLTNRAADLLDRRLPRRGFLTSSAMVATAVATNPLDLALRPVSAYAAVCSCSGSTCSCGALCCDGYTEFCCTIYGANSCPPGSVIGGWWKVAGSSYCSGGDRYYMDCHRPCGGCSCGGGGICAGSCNGTACGCGKGSCGNRKAGCTRFRYGNCAAGVACLGPIQCRVVSCQRPWELDSGCSTASRTDNATRSHNRPCLQAKAVQPISGDWNNDGTDGVGVFWLATGRWELRTSVSSGSSNGAFTYGGPGDRPVVGDWNGDGQVGIGIFRPATGEWMLRNTPTAGPPEIGFRYGGQAGAPNDVPVVGDWNGDGRAGIGVFRPSTGEWLLRNTATPGPAEIRFKYGGQAGAPNDVPVVGDWNGDGKAGIGVFRPHSGTWILRHTASPGAGELNYRYGGPGDQPVIGAWVDRRSGTGVFRRRDATWLLRYTASPGGVTKKINFGPKDYS